MAHSTTVPAASSTPAPHTDWYTFLRSAFLNGLKAYGAALMVIAPADPVEAQAAIPASGRTTPSPRIALQQSSPAISTLALPLTPLAKPAWRHA